MTEAGKVVSERKKECTEAGKPTDRADGEVHKRIHLRVLKCY